MNCPVMSRATKKSVYQNSKYALGGGGDRNVFYSYMGDLDGKMAPYYALPSNCEDLSGFPPACVIVAEYDPLRDDGIDFARKLLNDGVPTELTLAPRVGHGFCVVDHPLTRWVHDGICASFRREFGML